MPEEDHAAAGDEVDKMRMTHLSLFSGIGGLDLAAEWAGFETVGQCEWADYPTKVLEKHWPDVPRWRDIRTLTKESFYEKTGIRPGELSCISGGFPCQPHSLAGKRKASGDERDLWPEMRRVIGELKPGWVVAENVRGLLSSENGRFFRGILWDFAQMGYDVGWGVTSAAAVGAVHRRERVAIVAHTNGVNRKSWTGVQRNNRRTIQRSDKDCRLAGVREISDSAKYRTYDGIPHRVDRLKCLGNAVVPQQFFPIFRAIVEAERMKWTWK